jgi:sec-independent protein translocase protein TatC
MPLREHLIELRRRLVKSFIAIALGAVGGWFAYSRFFDALQAPLKKVAHDKGIIANINYTDLTSALNLHIKIAIYLGVIVASPVWLYQLWAFIVPGMTKREKRYAFIFVAAAVPLFVGGVAIGWRTLPTAITFLAGFAEEGTSVLPSADAFWAFATQLLLAFGVAFLLPLVLVALNLAGFVSALTLAKGWRIAVCLIFLFSAVASPSPEVTAMMALAFPMVGLYLAAVGIAWLIDRRRARRAATSGFSGLSDDEASPLDLRPSPLYPDDDVT